MQQTLRVRSFFCPNFFKTDKIWRIKDSNQSFRKRKKEARSLNLKAHNKTQLVCTLKKASNTKCVSTIHKKTTYTTHTLLPSRKSLTCVVYSEQTPSFLIACCIKRYTGCQPPQIQSSYIEWVQYCFIKDKERNNLYPPLPLHEKSTHHIK